MTNAIQAIQATLQGNWEQAITLNEELLQENPKDIETLNRLAFAYTAIGNAGEAKKLFQMVLDIDGSNPIALKNLKRLGDGGIKKNGFSPFHIDNTMFLEEVGKTKVISLVNTAPLNILRILQVGQPLTLCIKRSKIFVLDGKEQFLGMLPDNISRRLIKFLNGGNQYMTYVKAVFNRDITVFIKEIKRSNRFKNQPSFFISDSSQQSPIFIKKKKSHISSEGEETSEE